MHCTNCGHDIPEGAKFCPECGAPAPVVAAGAVPVESTPGASQAAPQPAPQNPEATYQASPQNPQATYQAAPQNPQAAYQAPQNQQGYQTAPGPQGGYQAAPGPQGGYQTPQNPYGNNPYAGYPGATMPGVKYPRSESDTTLLLIAFVFNVLGAVAWAFTLIGLAWAIPICIGSWHVYKGTSKNTVAMGVVSLLLMGVVPGVLMLIAAKDE